MEFARLSSRLGIKLRASIAIFMVGTGHYHVLADLYLFFQVLSLYVRADGLPRSGACSWTYFSKARFGVRCP